MPASGVAAVYLLHFSEPYVARTWPGAPVGAPKPEGWVPRQRVQHYLGWTEDLERRLIEHQCGRGSKLLRVIVDAGITFDLARVWEGPRALERALKVYSHSRTLCPFCSGDMAFRRTHRVVRRVRAAGGA